jgi:glutamate-1-semialdehyde 2,1-aminomutase
MEMIAPAGPVYQAGTLSGNPLAMRAGIVTLDALARPGVWEGIAARAAELGALIENAARAAHVRITVQRVGTMLTAFFTDAPVTNWTGAARCDTRAFGRWHRALLDHGVYWVPSQFEAAFLSAAHGDAEMAHTAAAMERAFQQARGT